MALLVVAAGCGGPATPAGKPASRTVAPTLTGSATPSAAGGAITTAWLRNATLPSDACGADFGWHPPSLVLVEGTVPGTGPSGETIKARATATGDLDGDGAADGVVTLDCYPGGNGYWFAVLVYTAARGFTGAAEYDEASGGSFAPVVENAVVVSGRLVVRWHVHSPDDAHCCPSRDATVTFRLAGGRLRTVTQTFVDPESTMTRLVSAVARGRSAAARALASAEALRAIRSRQAEYGALRWSPNDDCPYGRKEEFRCRIGTSAGWIFEVTIEHLGFGSWRAVAVTDVGGGR
jgi:hypothetical protein